MSRMKVKEIADRQKKNGDRNACSICNPRQDRIPHDKLWEWSKNNPGKSPLRGG